jgi:hypothetical protein
MTLRRTAVALAAVGAAAAVSAPAAMASTPAPGERSLATVLLADSAGDDANGFDRNWYDYDIVTQAALAVISARGGADNTPVGLLTKGGVPLTAFIPDDRSFQVLTKEITGTWYGTEKGVFSALAGAVGIDTIEQVLLYHVYAGGTTGVPATITKKTALGADNVALKMANGGTVTVDVVNRWLPLVVLKDADTNDVNPFVNPRRFDINAGNKQIAHGIVFVLRPANLP